jgi:hypothetical protein
VKIGFDKETLEAAIWVFVAFWIVAAVVYWVADQSFVPSGVKQFLAAPFNMAVSGKAGL